MNPLDVCLGAAPRPIVRRCCVTVSMSDDHGQWLVHDDARGRDVAFLSRRAAIRFAVFGTSRQPGGGAALMIPAAASKT